VSVVGAADRGVESVKTLGVEPSRKGWELRPLGQPQGVCTFDGCDAPHSARGLCSGHWAQQRAGRELKPLQRYGRWRE